MLSRSWYYIGIGAFVVVLLIYVFWGMKIKKEPVPEPHDTFYFCIIDFDGKRSCNHDSGIKPSTLLDPTVRLKALKHEYNDGKGTTLNGVKTILVGTHYDALKPVTIKEVIDLGDLYEIVINL